MHNSLNKFKWFNISFQIFNIALHILFQKLKIDYFLHENHVLICTLYLFNNTLFFIWDIKYYY